MDQPFIAMIMAWAATIVPRDWANCDGRQMSLSQNQALFSLISTTYGGNGQTFFNLPDLRGKTPIGAGQSPGGSVYQLGQSGGSEITTLTQNHMPSHTHGAQLSSISVTPVYSKNDAVRFVPNEGDVLAVVKAGSGPSVSSARAYGPNENTESGAAFDAEGSVTIDPAGGGIPINNMQPYLVINWVIALQGIYPAMD